MRGQAAKKLNSGRGETIGETLVALLIASLALLMLAGAVSAAWNVIMKSENTINKYYDQDKDLVRQADTSGNSIKVTIKDADGSSTIEQAYSGRYYSNETFNGVNVVAYKAGG